MRNFLRCRRGASAFATVIVLTPLIGVMALGGEAGSWYVIKQHAQNAADAAAYAGGLLLACQTQSQSAGGTCADTQSIAYRGGEFAAQNGFCDTTDYPSCSPPTGGLTQQVTITPTATQVKAVVTQTQPAQLAQILLGKGAKVPISATAVVQVNTAKPCILATTNSISFQGAATVDSPNCGLASNSTGPKAIDFTGNATKINAPSYTTGGCFENAGTPCSTVSTYDQTPVPNPLSGIDSALQSLTTSSFSKGQCSSLTAYDPTLAPCYNNGATTTLNGPLNGTYYFYGSVTINGSPTITGIATLILFGDTTNPAGLTITGTPTIQLTAEKTPAVPPAVPSSVQSQMTDLLIYDPEVPSNPKNPKPVNVTGNSSSYFNGIVYVPNAPVTYGGNSSVSTPNPGCFVVIAQAVQFSGSTNIDNSKCINDNADVPKVQYVVFVQ
jgi:Flp pilus assembly protein TadG